jgi:hypothetical protein
LPPPESGGTGPEHRQQLSQSCPVTHLFPIICLLKKADESGGTGPKHRQKKAQSSAKSRIYFPIICLFKKADESGGTVSKHRQKSPKAQSIAQSRIYYFNDFPILKKRIHDVYPASRIRIFSITDPHERI